MSRKIRIENGATGAPEYTSYANADFHVASRRAEWIDRRTIRFLDTDHRHASACRHAAATRVRVIIEGDGFAALDGLKHTPVMMPIRLLTGKRPATPPRHTVAVELSRRLYMQSF